MQRNILLDILKIILAIMVIGAHCNFLLDISPVISYTTVHGLFRITVPIFFIINGYFFLDVINRNQVKKWLKRVTVLYLVWMLIYIYYWARFEDFSFPRCINIILVGYHHLWYLNAMILGGIALYLMKKISNKMLLTIVVLLFIIGTGMQYMKNYEVFSNEKIIKILNDRSVYRNFIFFGLPFLSIGYLIRKTDFINKITKRTLTIVLLLSLTIFIFESLLNYLFIPVFNGFDMYFMMLLTCPIIFLCAMKFKITSNYNSKNLAMYSTGIYLIHPLLMIFVLKISSPLQTTFTLIVMILAVISTFFLIKINKYLKVIL